MLSVNALPVRRPGGVVRQNVKQAFRPVSSRLRRQTVERLTAHPSTDNRAMMFRKPAVVQKQSLFRYPVIRGETTQE